MPLLSITIPPLLLELETSGAVTTRGQIQLLSIDPLTLQMIFRNNYVHNRTVNNWRVIFYLGHGLMSQEADVSQHHTI